MSRVLIAPVHKSEVAQSLLQYLASSNSLGWEIVFVLLCQHTPEAVSQQPARIEPVIQAVQAQVAFLRSSSLVNEVKGRPSKLGINKLFGSERDLAQMSAGLDEVAKLLSPLLALEKHPLGSCLTDRSLPIRRAFIEYITDPALLQLLPLASVLHAAAHIDALEQFWQSRGLGAGAGAGDMSDGMAASLALEYCSGRKDRDLAVGIKRLEVSLL